MKRGDLKNYAPMPAHCYHKLMDAANSVQEEPIKSKSLSPALLIALLIVLFTVTAIAMAQRAGVLDFFASWKDQGIPQTPAAFDRETAEGEILLQFVYDDLVVKVTDVVRDGDDYYINTTIELQEDIPGHLVDIDAPDAKEEIDMALHAKDGLPVYYVRSYVLHGDSQSDSGDRIVNPDGSISALHVIRIMEASNVANMQCYVTYVKAEPGRKPVETSVHAKYIPFVLPLPEAIESRGSWHRTEIDSLGIWLDALYMKRTTQGVQCFSYIEYLGGEPVDFKLPFGRRGLTLRMTDAETGAIIVPRLNVEWIADAKFCGYNVVHLDRLPSTVTIDAIDENDGTLYGSINMEMEQSTFAGERLGGYVDNSNQMPDLRDMYFPWSDMRFVADTAYVMTGGQDSAPIYLDPTDDTTLVGHYYTGLAVSPNITYDGWTSVYFGDRDSTGTKGYIRSTYLVELPQESSHYGYAKAQTDVRIRPSKSSAIKTTLIPTERIILMGKMDGWYHIAREEEGIIRVIGYVPCDAIVQTTEEAE